MHGVSEIHRVSIQNEYKDKLVSWFLGHSVSKPLVDRQPYLCKLVVYHLSYEDDEDEYKEENVVDHQGRDHVEPGVHHSTSGKYRIINMTI